MDSPHYREICSGFSGQCRGICCLRKAQNQELASIYANKKCTLFLIRKHSLCHTSVFCCSQSSSQQQAWSPHLWEPRQEPGLCPSPLLSISVSWQHRYSEAETKQTFGGGASASKTTLHNLSPLFLTSCRPPVGM